jgi:hypothetical protein
LKWNGLRLQLIQIVFLRNSNNIVDYLFNHPGDLYNFGNSPIDFEDIVDVHDVHDLSADHADDSFVDLEDNPFFSLDLFHLLKESLDEHPQVELDLSVLLRVVGIDILYFDHLWDVSNDVHYPI